MVANGHVLIGITQIENEFRGGLKRTFAIFKSNSSVLTRVRERAWPQSRRQPMKTTTILLLIGLFGTSLSISQELPNRVAYMDFRLGMSYQELEAMGLLNDPNALALQIDMQDSRVIDTMTNEVRLSKRPLECISYKGQEERFQSGLTLLELMEGKLSSIYITSDYLLEDQIWRFARAQADAMGLSMGDPISDHIEEWERLVRAQYHDSVVEVSLPNWPMVVWQRVVDGNVYVARLGLTPTHLPLRSYAERGHDYDELYSGWKQPYQLTLAIRLVDSVMTEEHKRRVSAPLEGLEESIGYKQEHETDKN